MQKEEELPFMQKLLAVVQPLMHITLQHHIQRD